MINRKQVIVIGSVIILMGLLVSMDIKGLVKPKEGASNGPHDSGTKTTAGAVSLESTSELAKISLNAAVSSNITDMEAQLEKATASDKLPIQKKLAQRWEQAKQPAPAAFYYQAVANTENNFANWLKTGDLFTEAYQATLDTLSQPPLIQNALEAYQKALAFQPASLDAKTGLGVAYVSGAGSPMQGIQLLLEVVKSDPENVKANYNLGLFSMRSGQYDKAVSRFKTIIGKKSDPEIWFYLATSYENLGKKEEAILAYQKCRELASDADLSKFVDKKIEELKK